jgi:hypothetical protein
MVYFKLHIYSASGGLLTHSTIVPVPFFQYSSIPAFQLEGTSKNKAFLCALCELCGENIFLMLVHHV